MQLQVALLFCHLSSMPIQIHKVFRSRFKRSITKLKISEKEDIFPPRSITSFSVEILLTRFFSRDIIVKLIRYIKPTEIAKLIDWFFKKILKNKTKMKV